MIRISKQVAWKNDDCRNKKNKKKTRESKLPIKELKRS